MGQGWDRGVNKDCYAEVFWIPNVPVPVGLAFGMIGKGERGCGLSNDNKLGKEWQRRLKGWG